MPDTHRPKTLAERRNVIRFTIPVKVMGRPVICQPTPQGLRFRMKYCQQSRLIDWKRILSEAGYFFAEGLRLPFPDSVHKEFYDSLGIVDHRPLNPGVRLQK